MPFSLRSRVAKSSKVPESIAAFSTSHGGGELEKGRFNRPATLDVEPLKLKDKFSCYLLIRGWGGGGLRTLRVELPFVCLSD